MPKRKSRSRNLLAGGLATAATVVVVIVWLVQVFTGVDLGLDDILASEFADPPQIEVTNSQWYNLYFTEPQDEPTWRGGLDEILAADIDAARESLDLAVYDFDLQSVTDALIRAHQRGVQVRMVIDSDNMDLDQVLDLIEAGVGMVEDDRTAIMHDKFVVIDGAITWTGSWNLTDNGTYRNDNNAIRIVSQTLAEDYVCEFEEMFLEQQFGPDSPADTPYRNLTIDGTLLQVYFAPEDEVMDRLVELVSHATESIRFMAFSFTDDCLGAAIRERAAAGVLVEGVFESRSSDSEYSEYAQMRDAGMNVWLDGNRGMMHHKVIIIDGGTTVMGSFNFSNSANRSNDENVLIIHDRPIAKRFLSEFDRVVAQAR